MGRPYPVVAAVLLLAAHPLAAQERGITLDPVEIGVAAGRLAPRIYGDYSTQDLVAPTADLRLTAPLSRRFALEAQVMIGRRGNDIYQRTEGLYLIQLKQRLPALERSRTRPFLTYGLAGYYADVHLPPMRIPQPGGTFIDRPAVSYNEFDGPMATTIGGGVEYRLGSRLAVRGESQLVTVLYLPLAVRWSAGVSIPLGRPYSRN